MSDGMAFLTGAAFAGVAVLFMIKGGNNFIANGQPSAQQLPTPTANPYNPYAPTPQSPIAATPSPVPFNNYNGQPLDNERYTAMLNQQRSEIEQLKTQLQNQQLVIEKLTVQSQAEGNSLFAGSQPATALSPTQQQENSMLSGIVWALGGMAITISGGIVVVGALGILSRQQQRHPRTTYVVQQPYTALPPTVQHRRRAEVIPPQYEERHIDYVD